MDFNHSALIIVDMQNDFLHTKGFVPTFSKEIGVPDDTFDLLWKPVPNIKKLADFFHRESRPVVYIYTAWQADYSDVAIPLKKMRGAAQKAGALVEGSWGAQIIDELKPQPGSRLVMKKAYGGFFQTPLDRQLRNLGVKTLFMTGVATNFCVETTGREGVGYGYDVVMVSDATATYTEDGHQASLSVFGSGFGEVMDAEEVIAALSP